ncbi:tail collar domain [Micromonospora pisi]|uniref:Tail collar domain n=1 Tax=Micromonospora pisi TaxID=589240 RepID=A0A495JVM4_9ACTN|nr:phage tail protein [Micromonospora pisi]RKR92911.1 tail collar domain [Micromonospora pisi]
MNGVQQGRPAEGLDDGVLIGSVVGYGGVVSGNSPPPDGWLLCDGSAVSRATYDRLYRVIGDIHGSGDGTNTFNLPDYRGRFHRGVDDGTGNDPDSGSRTASNPGGLTGDRVGSVQPKATARPAGAQLSSNWTGEHKHWVPNVPVDYSHAKGPSDHYARWNKETAETSRDGKHSHTITGGDLDSTPVNAYLNYLIYYGSGSSRGNR